MSREERHISKKKYLKKIPPLHQPQLVVYYVCVCVCVVGGGGGCIVFTFSAFLMNNYIVCFDRKIKFIRNYHELSVYLAGSVA